MTSAGRTLTLAAAAVTAAAGVVHLRFAPSHLEEDALYGLCFYGMGAGQLAGALLLLALRRPPRGLLWAGIAGNFGIVALWLVTRTVGPPVGAEAWHPEAVGFADGLATACEVAAPLLLAPLLFRRTAFAAGRRAPVAAAALALALVPLVAVAAPAGHGAEERAPAEPHAPAHDD